MNTYQVRGIDLDHDGKRYPEGSLIELDDQEAGAKRRWLEPVDARPASAPEAPPAPAPAPANPPKAAKAGKTEEKKPDGSEPPPAGDTPATDQEEGSKQ